LITQDAADPSHSIGCSTESHPTAQFIKAHIDRYVDWSPYTGSIPVGSELIPTLILTGIFMFIIGVVVFFKRKDLGSYFQNVKFSQNGYQGIPNATQKEGHKDGVQMT
jgi:hypothetical protein